MIGGTPRFHPADRPVPAQWRTDRVLLRPLRVSDTALDYDAVMSSAPRLRRWSQTDWPADDFTLEENRADLERHEREHGERTAFTYTVLDPDATRCLGCVYIMPVPAGAEALRNGADFAAEVGFWVRESEVSADLDRHVLEALRRWFDAEWAFGAVLFTISPSEERQASLLAAAGLDRRLTFTRADGRVCWAYA